MACLTVEDDELSKREGMEMGNGRSKFSDVWVWGKVEREEREKRE